MADSSSFNINSTLPDLNKLLQRYPTTYTASTTSTASTAPYTGVESSAQASTQEPFSPLPPPRTPPPSGYEYYAASASLVYDTNNPPQWLQSPSPEVKIQRPEWQPNYRLHPDLAPVVKKVVNSMPAHHLLKPYDGETFKNPDAAFNRYQDYAFSKGFFIITLSLGNKTALWPHRIFSCKHHSKHTRNYRKLDNFRGNNSNRQ
ncbi:hypothetical protein V2W45_1326500 [Cenococcum geophilum]